MIHIDSPRSPKYEPSLTDWERIKRLVGISKSRMHNLSKNKTQEDVGWYGELDKRPEMGIQDATYYVELGLGDFGDEKPYHPIFLAMDTGSDVTWTQCEGCTTCFYQTVPVFPKDSSKTFRPCLNHECPDQQCNYHATYGDMSTVDGFWAIDKLTFPSTQVPDETKDGFTFVCGIDIHNFLTDDEAEERTNKITGILGMSRGEGSIMSQLMVDGLHAFSYCLPRSGQVLNEPSILRFGNFNLRDPSMSSTPLLESTRTPLYYLSLTGISVNDKLLNIPPQMFALKRDGSGGTAIDSGTSLSYLIPGAYKILEREIVKYMRAKNRSWTRYESRYLNACWAPTSSSASIKIPTMTFHFENGADLIIEPPEVMIQTTGDEISNPGHMYCLTVNSHDDMDFNLIGSYHQVDQLIVFDLQESKLFFVAAHCDM